MNGPRLRLPAQPGSDSTRVREHRRCRAVDRRDSRSRFEASFHHPLGHPRFGEDALVHRLLFGRVEELSVFGDEPGVPDLRVIDQVHDARVVERGEDFADPKCACSSRHGAIADFRGERQVPLRLLPVDEPPYDFGEGRGVSIHQLPTITDRVMAQRCRQHLDEWLCEPIVAADDGTFPATSGDVRQRLGRDPVCEAQVVTARATCVTACRRPVSLPEVIRPGFDARENDQLSVAPLQHLSRVSTNQDHPGRPSPIQRLEQRMHDGRSSSTTRFGRRSCVENRVGMLPLSGVKSARPRPRAPGS